MNRPVAIGLTIFTAVCCGLPGLAGLCLGVLALLGSQMPEVVAQNQNTPEEIITGAAIFLCAGLAFVVIPVVVGLVSFRLSKPPEPDYFGEPLPPPS
jgi:hypothetical protein